MGLQLYMCIEMPSNSMRIIRVRIGGTTSNYQEQMLILHKIIMKKYKKRYIGITIVQEVAIFILMILDMA